MLILRMLRRACAVVTLALPLVAGMQALAQTAPRPAERKPPAARPAAKPAAPAAEPTRPGFNFQIAPQPAWVVNAALPTGAPATPAPMHYRIIDEQVRVEGSSASEYSRVVRVIGDSAGLAVASQIELEFDPAYQTLVLHRLEVLRGSQRITKLDRKKVELLQREKQLEQRIYDGRVTASIVLDDMRVGDEIDLAYTIVGQNPVFGGKFVHATWLSSQRGPVMQAQMRLLAPAEREIRMRKGPADATQESGVNAGLRETLFRRSNVPTLRGEQGAPSSAFVAEQLQFSEFADWAEVAAWGDSLFRAGAATKVAAKADELRAAFQLPADQVREALRFVQQEVRYFGIEIGASSHRPSPPDQVLDQRFGDCKDKVALLAALLRRLDIPVQPVLVSTRLRGELQDMLPGPLAFDHVIARVELDGKVLFLDATRSQQSGAPVARSALGLGQGLALAPGVQALVALPAAFDSERMVVSDILRVHKFDQPTLLASRITYHGDLAEIMRDAVAAQGLPAIIDTLTANYVRAYPRLRRTGVAQVEPPGEDNSFTVVQNFELPEFWRFPEQRVLVADVWQWGPVEWLVPPKLETRRLPLAFPFPGIYRHRVRVEFPEDVYGQAGTRRADEGDRHFSVAVTVDGGRNFADYAAEVRIGVNQVEPADWAAFSAKVNQALPKLGTVVAVPAVPLAQADTLQAALKGVEEGLRSRRIKAVTLVQGQSQIKSRLLTAQIDSGRLAPGLRAQALVARGVAYDQMGQTEDGRKDFEAALALDAESLEALNGAAVNAQARGAHEQVLDYTGRVLQRQPRDGAALHTRAQAHYFAGRLAAARSDLDAVLADRSALRRGFPLIWLALATRRAGEDIAPLLQKYPREQWPTEWPRPVLDALFGTTTPDSALQAARGSKQPLEAQTEALFYLGEKLAIEGDVDKARAQWRKVLDLGVVEYVEYGAAKLKLAAAP